MSEVRLVLDALLEQGWFKCAQYFDLIDSTNSAARRYATDQPDGLPALFVADRQSGGRGRINRVWWSPPGCLMLTLAASAQQLPAERQQWSQLALITAVAASAAIESVCPGAAVQLKWPNDLYLEGRKAGGILIELMTPPGRPAVVLIGLGINVCVQWRDAPAEVAERATCLSAAAGQPVAPAELLRAVAGQLPQHIDCWCRGELDWHANWQSRCLLSGREVVIASPAGEPSSPRSQWAGRCEGVAPDGHLLVRTSDGQLARISTGEVIDFRR